MYLYLQAGRERKIPVSARIRVRIRIPVAVTVAADDVAQAEAKVEAEAEVEAEANLWANRLSQLALELTTNCRRRWLVVIHNLDSALTLSRALFCQVSFTFK